MVSRSLLCTINDTGIGFYTMTIIEPILTEKNLVLQWQRLSCVWGLLPIFAQSYFCQTWATNPKHITGVAIGEPKVVL